MTAQPTRPVLVLGAYGMAGRAVVAALRRDTRLPILAAGRRADRLGALVGDDGRVGTRRLDLADAAALRRACGEAGTVINCVGPYLEHGERVARAALHARAACVDVASEQEHFRRLLARDAEARRAGVPLVTGAGLYPGISGLLLADLRTRHPEATRAEGLLAMGRAPAEDVGEAALWTALYELAHPLQELRDGRLREVEPGGPAARRTLPPPFGDVELLPWPQLEILAAARAGGLSHMETRIAMAGLRPVPAPLLRALRALAPERRPWLRRLLGPAVRGLHRRAHHSPEARRLGPAALVAARVGDARGAFRSTFSVPDGARATAWLPALLATRAAAGELPGGVATPPDVTTLDALLSWLRSRGEAFELRSDEPPEAT